MPLARRGPRPKYPRYRCRCAAASATAEASSAATRVVVCSRNSNHRLTLPTRCVNLWFSCLMHQPVKTFAPQILFGFLILISPNMTLSQAIRCPESRSVGGGMARDRIPDGFTPTKPLAPATVVGKNSPMRITSKPIAQYTQLAKNSCIEGQVVLRITFFADGTVGEFRVIKALPLGLSQAAIDAAERIKFIPAQREGKPITVRKLLAYNFTIY